MNPDDASLTSKALFAAGMGVVAVGKIVGRRRTDDRALEARR